MATRKFTRKVISLPKSEEKKEKVVERVEEEGLPKEVRSKRGCLFCLRESDPAYTDIATLRRFLTDRAKIVRRERSGICSKHQRAVAKNIKYARHLGLLPFIPKV